MKRTVPVALACFLLVALAYAAKPHVISFGKAMLVKFFIGPTEKQTVEMKIRPLYVDNQLKEFTTGESHDVTDQMFVVRRVYRLNDRLPDEPKGPNFLWQRGGWISVNRSTGRISQLAMPEFDPFYSSASWYRDYVAYCGLSPDGEKLFAVVAQLGSKKPVLRQRMGDAHTGDQPDSLCEVPTWERQPARVTFAPKGGQKVTFTIHGRTADLAGEPETPQPESK